jgi:hypothetical protein
MLVVGTHQYHRKDSMMSFFERIMNRVFPEVEDTLPLELPPVDVSIITENFYDWASKQPVKDYLNTISVIKIEDQTDSLSSYWVEKIDQLRLCSTLFDKLGMERF